MNNGLLSKLITGTSTFLNTANQIVPIYGELKPLFKNIINIKNKLKDININKYFQSNNLSKNNINKKEEVTYKYPSSNPQFFL
jgi:hypothetical protein